MQRLIRDRGSYGEQQFTYDKVGNRLSYVHLKQQPALNDDSYDDSQSQSQSQSQIHREDYNYAPASNRLLGTSEKQILLDQGGNLLYESSERNRAYNYNAQNRISEYVENGQLKARYHYNALGQRIHKAVIQNDGTEQHTLFHYGQQGELQGETQIKSADTSEASHTQNIVWLQMRPVVVLDSSASSTSSTNSKPADTQISWLHSDHLLTARAATDANQNRIWRWHSDAFGVGEAESFTVNNGQSDESTEETFTLNLRFPGQYHDAESGLHYNYHRTYDPSMGRYTQSDPIGLMGGVNTFAYVGGSPLRWVDSLGLARDPSESSAKSLDEIEADYRKMISGARFIGWDVAAGNLEYFLSAQGGSRQIDSNWLRAFRSIKEAELKNQRRFESQILQAAQNLSDGQSTNIEDFWDAGIYAGIVELELFYASGGSTLTSAGVFTLSMTCGELAISGSVSHDWFDPYDWHADLSAYIPGFGSVSDADAIRLQEAGRAAEFDMKSQWKQDLHWNQDTQSFEWK